MSMTLQSAAVISDEQLWQQSRSGDREAFGRIVERYQSLVCSVAYSTCGNLSRSEDLAQETFVTAWRQLGALREPARLGPWLCGIARNHAANATRRENRRGGPAESLDAAAETAAPDADPSEQAASQEEAALLWRWLAELPATYREPLVLFYRQGQSVAEVAGLLDLSEEAVKQRLSSGRVMLREELTTLVASVLTRTRPGPAFTAGVLAVLPLVTATTATSTLAAGAVVGGTGKAGAAGKGLLAAPGFGAWLGPILGLGVGWMCARLAASTARSLREREVVLRYARQIVIFCFFMSVGLAGVLSQAGKRYPASPLWVFLGIAAWLALLLGTILWTRSRVDRVIHRIREETGTADDAFCALLAVKGEKFLGSIRHESRARFLGLPLWCLAIHSLEEGGQRSRSARGWVAMGDLAISPLFAFGGVAIAPIALGGVTIGLLSLSLWGVAVGVLAFGSLSLGWCAFGLASGGWRAAWGGGVALARDYAVGGWVYATEANSVAAKQWFADQWFSPFMKFFASHAQWLIVGAVVISLVGVSRRVAQLRRISR